ncbi:MAG: hypothetical protein P4L38_08845 [Syntrophaceae bacterium]|nr:hypothetical protein [Syntrophaceae bacterium]
MKRQLFKNSSVMFVATVFFLMAGLALAEKKHWFVVKDKDGMCKVIEAETAPGPLKTIAGPFKTMKKAEKIMAKECPKGAGPAPQQLRRHQEQGERMRLQHEQAEPMRRQHMQREELQQQQDLKKQQTPQQQQTEKMKGKAPEKIEGTKSSGEKVKEKTKEPIPSDKKN